MRVFLPCPEVQCRSPVSRSPPGPAPTGSWASFSCLAFVSWMLSQKSVTCRSLQGIRHTGLIRIDQTQFNVGGFRRSLNMHVTLLKTLKCISLMCTWFREEPNEIQNSWHWYYFSISFTLQIIETLWNIQAEQRLQWEFQQLATEPNSGSRIATNSFCDG